MTKNYPRSIEESLSIAGNVAAFDRKVLGIMKEDIRSKINYNWDEIDDKCNIYKDYHAGESYVAGCDVGQGVGGDYSAFGIMDSGGQIVADIVTNDVKPEDFTELCIDLLKHYRNPWWWKENNFTGGGRTVIRKAAELQYRKLGYRGEKPIQWFNLDEEIKRIGFFTGEKERADLFGQLIPAINDNLIRVYNSNGLDQFFSVIRNADKGGRIEATSGKHDDYVIMTGICWVKRKDKIGISEDNSIVLVGW
jgi:hypothetical protein